MSEFDASSSEGQAFLAKLWQYRGSLPANEQRMLDALISAAGGSRDDVQGYTLFGTGGTFGAPTPFGGGSTFGTGNTFGSSQTFGSGLPPQNP